MRYMEKTLTVRVSEEELALWREAAWVRRVSLSAWVRALLTANAEKVVADERE